MPTLTVKLEYAGTQARLDRVRTGSLDATFLRGIAQSRELRLVPVWEDRLLAALPVRHPVVDNPAPELVELTPLTPRIAERTANPPLFGQVMSACHDCGFTPKLGQASHGLQNTLALIGADGESWTSVYEPHTRVLRIR